MQEIVRTIDTTEAFKYKIEQLNKELSKKENELSKLENVGVFTSASGGIFKFIGLILYLIAAFFILGCIVFYFDSFYPDKYLAFLWGSLGTVLLIIGFVSRRKGKRNILLAEEKRKKAEEEKIKLQAEINQLKSAITRQEQIVHQHMLNQQELLEREIEAIERVSTRRDDTKECPQCAEIIKAKAKICRYCNYQFEDSFSK